MHVCASAVHACMLLCYLLKFLAARPPHQHPYGQCQSCSVSMYTQVASLQEAFPGMVGTFYMSYLSHEEHISADAAVCASIHPSSGSAVSKLALPSTASGAVLQASTAHAAASRCCEAAQVHVPKITFLYRCQPPLGSPPMCSPWLTQNLVTCLQEAAFGYEGGQLMLAT